MRAPLSPNESERLGALRGYGILDTPPESAFEDLVSLASDICGVPIAAVSLVDEKRQWFKAIKGLDARETPISVSFCAHAILQPEEIFEVNDATQDPRFLDNELVTGAPEMRFYAGTPLVDPQGHALGTLCVIDTRPRALSPSQRRALATLGRQAVALLELHAAVLAHRRQAEEMRDLRDQAFAAARAKDNFLSAVSHELRTPLNGVLGVATMLAHEPLTDAQGDLVRMIEKSARGLIHVVDDVMDFSALGTDAAQERRETFEPGRLAEEVADLYAPEARLKGLGLVVETRLKPVIVRGDAPRIRQVLNKLLDNAIKFSERGKVEIEVEEPRSGVLRFTVRDEGIGIGPHRRQEIFELFQQGEEGNTRRYGGTGLGLSLCRRIVAFLDGAIGFDSRVNGGSTFWFEVPVQRMDLDEIEGAGIAPLTLAELEGRRVLVAEDNAVNMLVITAMLERNGVRVLKVENGRMAVEAAREDRFDAILMDLQMPEMDGIEATRLVRERDGETPVIAITASSSDTDREAAKDAGMNDYLAKPLTEESILSALRRWLT